MLFYRNHIYLQSKKRLYDLLFKCKLLNKTEVRFEGIHRGDIEPNKRFTSVTASMSSATWMDVTVNSCKQQWHLTLRWSAGQGTHKKLIRLVSLPNHMNHWRVFSLATDRYWQIMWKARRTTHIRDTAFQLLTLFHSWLYLELPFFLQLKL